MTNTRAPWGKYWVECDLYASVEEAALALGDPQIAEHPIPLTTVYLAADVDKELDALQKGMYIRHRPECLTVNSPMADCTCGLESILIRLRARARTQDE